MKKITALVLSVILITAAALCITVNAADDHFSGYSADWYAYAGAILWNQGNSDTLVKENLQTYDMHDGAPAADIVGFYGWAALKEGKIKTFGIKLDGGAMIDSPLSRQQDASLDRTAELAKAGIVNGEGFWLVFYYTDLGPGMHNAAFYAIRENDEAYEIFNYDFNVNADGEWLCGANPVGSINTGWWFNPVVPQPDDRYVNVEFTAKNAFSGVHGFYFCNYLDADHGPANMTVELLKDDKVVASGTAIGDANSWVDTDFGKNMEPGKYTLKYTCLEGEGADRSWFVIGAANQGSGDTVVSGNVNVTDGVVYPAIMLIPAEEGQGGDPGTTDPGTTDPGTTPTTPTNPNTADAAVIAIAAVACIALAGAVIAKKIK